MRKMTIGEFLSYLRKENDYTQEDIAIKLGVSAKTISSWENDRTYPDITLLPVIADLYGVTVDELIRGERLGNHVYKEQDANLNESNENKQEQIKQEDEEAIIKSRKLNFVKFKENRFICNIISISSVVLCFIGIALMFQVAIWTMCFAILGLLGTISSIIYCTFIERDYLIRENILVKEDIVREKYPVFLNAKINKYNFLIINIIYYLVIGLILILVVNLTKNPILLESQAKDILAILAKILSGVSFVLMLECISRRERFIKRYGTINQNKLEKKNRKLTLTLFIILLSFGLISFISYKIISQVTNNKIVDIYDEVYFGETKEDVLNAMYTYEVIDQELINAGLKEGDIYHLNYETMLEETQDWQWQIDEKTGFRKFENVQNYKLKRGVHDLGNGFVYIYSVAKAKTSAAIYQNDVKVSAELYDSLIYAYNASEIKTNIQCEISYEIGVLTIPDEVFVKEYDYEDDFYYMNLKIGEYDLGNNYTLKVTKTNSVITLWEGLYYRTSKEEIIDKWIQCNTNRLYWTVSDDNICYYLPNISNTIDFSYHGYKVELLGVEGTSAYELGYLYYGKYEGKYGYLEYVYYPLNEVYEKIKQPILIALLLCELGLAIILWKRQKPDFTFNYKENQ